MITLYDIPSTVKCWSPNVWKARYTLNYKGLPYTTKWVEYPDIKSTVQPLGAEPAGEMRNGVQAYSLPVIHDSKTGKVVSDSECIAEYLDEAYPDTPKVMLPGTKGLLETIGDPMAPPVDWAKWVAYQTYVKLNEESRPFFRAAREMQTSGLKLEDLPPKPDEREGALKSFVGGLKPLADVLERDGRGPFVLGDTPSFADFFLASYVFWLRLVWGEESEEWKVLAEAFDGKLAKLLINLSSYETIV